MKLLNVVFGLVLVVVPALSQNDPLLSRQWAMFQFGILELLGLPPLSQVPVVVIDTGIAADHPDIRVNHEHSKSFVGGDPLIDEEVNWNPQGHGTMTAGIITALTDNGIGIAGISSSDVISFQVYKAYDSSQGRTSSPYIEAIIAAFREVLSLESRTVVVHASIAWPVSVFRSLQLNELRESIRALGDKALVVVPAGNTGDNDMQYPCAFSLELPNVVCVGSMGRSSTLSSFSTRGHQVDLAAPGEMIMTTTNRGEYVESFGTSFAAPIVSGVAANIWSANPGATPAQVKRALIDGGTPNLLLREIRNPIQVNGSGALAALKKILSGKSVPQITVTGIIPSFASHENLDGSVFAPGDLVTIYGSNFTEKAELFEDFPLPTQLSDVQVVVNGYPAGLYYAGPNQVNVVIPSDSWKIYGENNWYVLRKNKDGSTDSWVALPPFKKVAANPNIARFYDYYPYPILAMENEKMVTGRSDEETPKPGQVLTAFCSGLGKTSTEVIFIESDSVEKKAEILNVLLDVLPGLHLLQFRIPEELRFEYAATVELRSGGRKTWFTFNIRQ